MKRREAVKQASAVAVSAIALPRAVMVDEWAREPGVTVLDSRRLLSIYDPTLDINARPVFWPDDYDLSEFEPLGVDAVNQVRSDNCDSDVLAYVKCIMGDTLKANDFRATLNGKVPRGVFAASERDGWIRFLAMRPNADGKMEPYSNRARRRIDARWSHYDRAAAPGPVHGIAFGDVRLWVRKGKIVRLGEK